MASVSRPDDQVSKRLIVRELHPHFGAEISGVDFSEPLDNQTTIELLVAIAKYGVLVARGTALDDAKHIALGRTFGDLDDIKPYISAGRPTRLQYDELFDVSNIELDGSLLDPGSARAAANKGNSLFHTDSSFNPRRAGYSLLLAHELPPKGMGGQTEFVDTRRAWDTLPDGLKKKLLERDRVANHSMFHSKKLAAPEHFADVDVESLGFGRHRLVQTHEPSGRTSLYLAAHIHHIDDMPRDESDLLIKELMDHATEAKNVLRVEWENVGDLVIWDNTCLMHRAVGGEFVNKHRRDMRRVTVHDMSSSAWGLNERSNKRQGLP